MAESAFILEEEHSEQTNLKALIARYLRYWPWFLAAVIISVGLGYLYMRYAPIVYESTAKIEIIDESQGIDITSEALSLFGQGSSVNMENEVQVLRSYRILRQVVETLNLDISYYQVGNVKTTEIWNPPFAVTKLVAEDSLETTRAYDIRIEGINARITDESETSRTVSLMTPDSLDTGLPFDITLRPDAVPEEYAGIQFRVTLTPIKQAVLNLAEKIRVEPVSKDSEILALSIRGQSVERSEAILNELINKFNQDGIKDRQLVSKRTLDFIDERFLSLSQELDSIEVGKEDFKRTNDLSYLDSDVDFSLQRRAVAQDEVTQLETQVSLADLLKKAVTAQSSYGLLPVDVGLENSGLNSMVAKYNQMALEREELLTNVGESHPTLIAISNQLQNAKVNIMKTLNIYQTQLKLSLRQLTREKNRANTMFSRLPEKEKMLRSIERQQDIKENLFILLLQKREEAALSYAVTAPSIKVVDYALTDTEPLSPKKRIVYPMSFMIGLFVPFIVLYLHFTINGKIQDRTDLVRLSPEVPILAEIPTFKKSRKVINAADRSVLAESFRIATTNLDTLLSARDGANGRGAGGASGSSGADGAGNAADAGNAGDAGDAARGKCVLVTSSVKGEGKTTTALNMAQAYASMHHKVLLVGADLRNRELMNYFKPDSFSFGLSEYLSESRVKWEDVIAGGFDNLDYLKVCFGGKMPPNPTQLLSGKGFARFIQRAVSEFDIVILDSPPSLSVADPLLLAKHADATVYITRTGITDKNMVRHARELQQKKQLPNMAFVINDVGSLNSRKYQY
ncbi:GumC family protein [Robiginitalea biformata]|uniref:non-specific protein-tyrosine kinase n=1 Tax=Robiginitalea biformata (strain ATCC BAA-864 / DSM 15991 / KCTC 12146 / HTCC2501) TaxID=313596 RepID=A4CP31_ROBBH|nr:polysaccharide biosynthesis tyrosine autokinase [Robiginitalea biformata]EAR14648.1 tyrosine-protein kinase ptk [Robiginitalea biformata HTCC2501]